MKVYFSTDMEGITGINNIKYLIDNQPEYDRGRRLMMQDLNVAIEGAVEAGATEILVNDAHGSMRNLIIEDLHEAADLITGFPKSNSMMCGIDKSFDVAMFIGYHAKNGSKGIISHTKSLGSIDDIKINGKSYGETGINAAIAGFYNVPVAMVSGDNILQEEVLDIIPDVEYAMTKVRESFYAGKMINPKKTRKLIKEKVKKGLLKYKELKAFDLGKNLELEIKVKSPLQADVIEQIPCVKRISPTEIIYNAENIIEAYNLISTVTNSCSILNLGR